MNKEMALDLIGLVNGLKELPKTKSVDYATKSGGKLKFQYVPLDDLLNKVKEENNFALLQPLGTENGVSYIQNILIHKSGETIESGKFMLQLTSSNMQDVGSVITYTRRYSLGAFLGIAIETDNDANHDSAVEEVKATDKQVQFLTTLLKGDLLERALTKYNLKELKDIGRGQASELIEMLKKASK